jgi:Glycosyl hydrolase family 26
MRSRSVILLTVVIAVAAAVFAIIRVTSSGNGSLTASPASYLGVYESGALTNYQLVNTFTNVAGQQPNLVGYYSGWGEPFQTSFAETASKHGAATIMQWDPTDIPVSKIAAGDYDTYVRSFAASVRSFGHPVVIGFGHEMNANWYSWGYGQLPPATFVAAWQHIVTVFRKAGVSNVTWLWTIQADEPGTGPIASWWPGAQYVNWVGIDGYYYDSGDTFASIFGKTIAQVRELSHLPVLVSEAGVGPAAGQAQKIPDLFAGMRAYGTLGLVYFDIAQNQGTYHQDWRIENSPAAESAFRNGATSLKLASP